MAENPDRQAIQQTIEGLATAAAAPERSETGPGTVEPSTQTQTNELIATPLPPVEVQQWWDRVKRARVKRDQRIEEWDILLKEYLPKVAAGGTAEVVKYNGHFRNLHSKLPQLFFQCPDLILTPKSPSPLNQTIPNPMMAMDPNAPPLKMEDIVSIKQAVLGDALGREGIKAERLMDELLFDVLGWSGIAFCKLGYRCVQKQFNKPVMQPDSTATSQPGSVLGLGGAPPQMIPQMGLDGQPATTQEMATIYREWFARRFSPKKGLLPDDLYSTRHEEDATWKGMEFFMSPVRAKAILKLTDEQVSKCVSDDLRAKYDDDKDENTGLIHGVEIFCKSEYYTKDQPHPKAFHQLILIEGMTDVPAVWRPCTDQTFDERGQLTPDSIDRNPIQVLTIRDLADNPYPRSDAAYTNTNVKEIGTYRRQSVKIRDAAIGKTLYDMDALDKEDVKTLQNADVGEYIGVEAGKLEKGADKIMARTPQIQNTNDDYRNAMQLKTDMDDTMGIGPESSGGVNDTVHSATEVRNSASGIRGRNKKEQSRALDFYLDVARHIDQLLMRYATETEYTQVAGPSGAKTIQAWNRQIISGRYLYEISPDSQLQIDNEQDWLFSLNFYNLAAKDPLLNRSYVLRRLARMRRFDPNQVVLPAPPPAAPKPDLPSISFSFKTEDILLGMGPLATPEATKLSQYLLLILEKATATAPQPTGPHPQPAHGGTGEALNQHSASNSGRMQNTPGAMNHREEMPK